MKIPVTSALILCVLGLAASGCGRKTVPVSGKIHQNNKVMDVKQIGEQTVGRLSILFYEMDKSEPVSPHEAIVNYADGTFTVPGPKGNGIPAGKYRITVSWNYDGPLDPDKLGGVFDEQNSKIIREVNGSDAIVINAGNPPTGDAKK